MIGVTGGIGMGKSTTARLMEEQGLPVVDTDQIAREIVGPGQAALEEIKQAFGPEMIGADGLLRRDELARHVFADTSARQQLEAITHPRIRRAWLNQVEAWRAEGRPRCAVVIPLLFETNAAAQFDAILCVACTPTTQRQRLRARDWSAEQIEQRIAAQWPIEKKMTLSHFVIWTEAGLEVHREQLGRILGQTLKR